MHIAPLDRQAGLTGIHVRSPHRRARSYIHIGIVEHQHGIFSAQFQHHRQHPFRRHYRNAFARSHTSCED